MTRAAQNSSSVMGGGSGTSEYRSEGFVGSFTSFLRCWMEGGRPLVPFGFLVDLALARAALGSVAKALFSCSSRARRNAVD